MSEAAPTESFKPLRQEKPTEGGCILASKWAVTKSLMMLRLVGDCLGDRCHVKILPQKLSVKRGEPISS